MSEDVNYLDLEMDAGRKASIELRRDLVNVLGVLNIEAGSNLLKTTRVLPVERFDSLDHIAIKTPYYVFMQHYGFEGIKSNGIRMSMKPFEHFTKLLNSTRAIENLAEAIGDIRADEITAAIRF